MDNSNFNFDITDSALNRINELALRQNISPILRISVEGGGCSGFSYKYELVVQPGDGNPVNQANSDDYSIAKDGVTILVDPLSQEFLSGSILDFIQTLGGSHFAVKNPNATAKCGCGNSFAI